MFSPADIDGKSLALHRLVVQKIRHDPELFNLVQQTLNRQYEKVNLSSLPYVVAWQKLVDLGMEAALAAAVEETERGQALRQTSPFSGILSEQERQDFFKSWSRSDEPA